MLEAKVKELYAQLIERFDSFERETQNMWDNISAAKFRELQKVIISYHRSLGGILCALSVKMDAWHSLFPKREIGSPQKRGEFIMIEMCQGIHKIKDVNT
jgi:hypothetical protein